MEETGDFIILFFKVKRFLNKKYKENRKRPNILSFFIVKPNFPQRKIGVKFQQGLS